jgi:hypothetical protein
MYSGTAVHGQEVHPGFFKPLDGILSFFSSRNTAYILNNVYCVDIGQALDANVWCYSCFHNVHCVVVNSSLGGLVKSLTRLSPAVFLCLRTSSTISIKMYNITSSTIAPL